MILFATATYTYAGLSRWTAGFGNPNKTAVLFACLALVAFAVALRARRDVVSWMGGALCAVAVFALQHTFSRGGLVACGCGALIVCAASLRALRSPRRWIPLVLLVSLACGLPTGRAAFARLAASAPAQESSAGNRLVIWREVPRMMADAPGGWGLGNSGAAFMSWYQPLDRRESYRTLVGSHFTWLVELGFWGRCAYLAGWLLVLALCGLRLWRRGDPLPLALWTCLGVASVFSSVAEAGALWILPGLALAPPVATYVQIRRERLFAILPLGAGLAGLALVAGVVGWGERASAAAPVRIQRDAAKGWTVVRRATSSSVPKDWLVCDPATLGGPSFGHRLRAALPELPEEAWGLADTVESVPHPARRLVLSGSAADDGPSLLARFPEAEEVRVLSPARPAAWCSVPESVRLRVYCGEFAANCPAEEHPRLTVVFGAKDFLPDWAKYAFGQERIPHRGD